MARMLLQARHVEFQLQADLIVSCIGIDDGPRKPSGSKISRPQKLGRKDARTVKCHHF